MGLFDRSTRIRHRMLARSNGVTLRARRGNEVIEELVAVPANVRHGDYGVEGFNATGREKDWLVWASDYKFGATLSDPQRNDEFDVTGPDGTKRTYTVLPRVEDGRCAKFTDQTQLQLRVYTLEVPPTAEA